MKMQKQFDNPDEDFYKILNYNNNSLTTATATSLPLANLSSTDLDCPQLFSAITEDKEAHSEYMVANREHPKTGRKQFNNN